MKYVTVEILKEETYRSKPSVNMADDMVRITFSCSRKEWRELKKYWRINERRS